MVRAEGKSKLSGKDSLVYLKRWEFDNVKKPIIIYIYIYRVRDKKKVPNNLSSVR